MSVKVIGERQESHEDLRWGTQNTKLASALLVLGFQLAAKQPFSAVISGKNIKTVTIWFFPYILKDGAGNPLQDASGKPMLTKTGEPKALLTREVEAEWAAQSTRMPWLYWMRRALEARDFLIKQVINGSHFQLPTSGVKPSMWRTDSVVEASVALSCEAKFHGLCDRRFYFQGKAELIVAQAKHFESKGRPRWAISALLQQALLVSVIKGRESEATSTRVRDTFGTAWIPKDMDPRLKEAYLRQINLGK